MGDEASQLEAKTGRPGKVAGGSEVVPSGQPQPEDAAPAQLDVERLLAENLRLRAELDEVRLENQRLHVRVLRLARPTALLRELLTTGWRGAKQSIRRMAGNLGGGAPLRDLAEPSPGFRPYKVRLRHPVGADRPRVLHAIGNFHTGGSSRLIVDLIEQLGDRFQQEIVTRDNPPLPGYVGVELHDRPRWKSAGEPLALLKRVCPDLLHVHFLGHHGNRYSARDWAWYSRLFEAVEAYGCDVIENVNIPVPPYVSDRVRCYVFVSDYVRSRFGRSDARNVTIYPGSDLARFSRRSQASVPDDCIGMVYRLEADKLDERAIDAFIEVIRRRPFTRALIVGGGRFLETYRSAVVRAGVADAFTFTGYVAYEGLPELYERMSLFIAPVHTESFGHVTPLAMGMEIPVVGYDVGALPEIVGDPGLLAPSGDSAGLAGIILELLDDRNRRLRIGAGNRQRAQRLFSVESMVAAYAELYEELLKADGP